MKKLLCFLCLTALFSCDIVGLGPYCATCTTTVWSAKGTISTRSEDFCGTQKEQDAYKKSRTITGTAYTPHMRCSCVRK